MIGGVLRFEEGDFERREREGFAEGAEKKYKKIVLGIQPLELQLKSAKT
jgi:hypothetical protein